MRQENINTLIFNKKESEFLYIMQLTNIKIIVMQQYLVTQNGRVIQSNHCYV